ncbi:hypothetical protein FN846DRAFT_886589 [Sphaerosporella brunnea]|uniref:Uncharacterized protein n=1 Tax=Sphaerosporella brunnea TaxID=1250544 RepID=A0A5J5F902_9PEZI|nr:hypothetical protein FN846DRAFT_886589 [Sphaerosporella brunnea]
MRIGSLLNDGPSDSPTTDTLTPYQPSSSSSGNLEQRLTGHKIPLGGNSILSAPSMSGGAFSPCQQVVTTSHEHTTSSQNTCNEPSSVASIATANWNVGRALGSDASNFPSRDQRSQQPSLPPFTSLVGLQQAAVGSIEGPVSPRSTHQHLSPQGGYFPAAYPPQYAPVRTYSQSTSTHHYIQPGQSVVVGVSAATDALMRFADVAMESATIGGRRNLEEVAAAEMLSGRRSSFAGVLGVDVVRPERRDATSIDIDPALRSSGFPSSQLEQKARTSSMATQTVDDVPLFPYSSEPSTPTASSSTGTLAVGTSSGSPTDHSFGSLHEFLNEEPKCSYCSVCTTGSPLRKVVSHIFGRNKLSTRQIPKNVWVYYCRKHYQRSRYRNPRGFARQQVLLVRRQCERLEKWGGVTQWVIKVRRREEIRMMHQEGDNTEDMEDLDEEIVEGAGLALDGEMETHEHRSGGSSRRSSTTATLRRRSSAGSGCLGGAGSNWLAKHTGHDKTIRDVYRLLDRIEVEVQQNGGKFPDVELLPSVDLELAGPIGTNNNTHSDNDGDRDAGEVGDSPKSRKRGRPISTTNTTTSTASGTTTEGAIGGDNGGLASKKAKSSDFGKQNHYKTSDPADSCSRDYSMSPGSRSPISGGFLMRSQSGAFEFFGQQLNLSRTSPATPPPPPPCSPSNLSHQSSPTASWEKKNKEFSNVNKPSSATISRQNRWTDSIYTTNTPSRSPTTSLSSPRSHGPPPPPPPPPSPPPPPFGLYLPSEGSRTNRHVTPRHLALADLSCRVGLGTGQDTQAFGGDPREVARLDQDGRP